jgi:hypothetical protein
MFKKLFKNEKRPAYRIRQATVVSDENYKFQDIAPKPS